MAVEVKSMDLFKAEIDSCLVQVKGLRGEGRTIELGGRDSSAKVEWRSGLGVPNGLILLLSHDLILIGMA